MKRTFRLSSQGWSAVAALCLAIGCGAGFLIYQGVQGGVAGCHQEDLADWPAAVTAAAPASSEEAVPADKRVFLTFDDGPSATTEKILDVLKEKEVHATFFVIAAENNKDHLPLLQRTAGEGHAIALHSCSHEYNEIYSSTAAYWEDIDKLKAAISPYLDHEPTWLRFPGGSTNTVSHRYGGSGIMKKLKEQAEEKGYHTLDWNVCADDAVGGHPSADTILNNIIKDVGKGKDTCVVLMHDTKATKNTAAALPAIIDWFKEQGYRFCTVEEEAP